MNLTFLSKVVSKICLEISKRRSGPRESSGVMLTRIIVGLCLFKGKNKKEKITTDPSTNRPTSSTKHPTRCPVRDYSFTPKSPSPYMKVSSGCFAPALFFGAGYIYIYSAKNSILKIESAKIMLFSKFSIAKIQKN